MNVALIVLDAVRADHVGCYGYERPTTPNLDAFAAAKTRYRTVVSPGVRRCSPGCTRRSTA